MFKINTVEFDCRHKLFFAVEEHRVRGRGPLGNGAFATVYSLDDPNVVLKISTGDDAGYLAFLKTLEQLQVSNRHLPVIHSVTHFRLSDKVREELRNKERYCLHYEYIVTYMERLKQPPKSLRGCVPALRPAPVGKWAKIISDYVSRDSQYMAHLSDEHQELITFLKIALEFHLKDIGESYGRFDLHRSNAMLRGKTIVVTDPLA